jgi:Tfp pilus assembly ATPase PilU
MITFDQYLLNLVRDGKVTIESAMKNVSSQHDFMLALQQAGMTVPVDSMSPAHSA